MPFEPREKHWAWKGDDAGYGGLHLRVRRERGPASDYKCECGNQSQEWSRIAGRDGCDVQDYVAKCLFCHRAYDKSNGGTGSWPRGEGCWNSVLTADDVEDIRVRHGFFGEGSTAIAREYGVSKGAVDGVIHFRNWRHLNACEIGV
jgi:hypothetical protein